MTTNPDIVIVGAGSAGCVLAARLSEDPTRQVLLLEAGPNVSVEALPDELRWFGRGISWPYEWGDEVQSIGGRRLAYGRGRMVGGSSATNGGIALRPEPPDIARWPAPWTWDRMLEHLCRVETDLDFGAAPYHGADGPVVIERWARDTWSPLYEVFQRAAVAAGIPECDDQNAPDTTGIGAAPMNRLGRERLSNARAFLDPARSWPNLTVRSDTHVRRVVVDGGRATGVELADGTAIRAGLVVLSAGVVQNPLLLWRSGVGPADAVRDLGIDPVADLPAVGRHLTDHFVIVLAAEVPLTLVDEDAPSIQTILRTTSTGGEMNDVQLTPYLRRHPDGRRSLAISIAAQIPVGTGTIRPASARLEDAAQISWPFAGIDANLRVLREGWRLAAKIIDTAGIAVDPNEVRRAAELGDDELDALIRDEHTAFYHGVGTCRMVDDDHADAGVVTPDLFVRGVESLAIVDASVVPTVPRSNTHILVTALADAAVALQLQP